MGRRLEYLRKTLLKNIRAFGLVVLAQGLKTNEKNTCYGVSQYSWQAHEKISLVTHFDRFGKKKTSLDPNQGVFYLFIDTICTLINSKFPLHFS